VADEVSEHRASSPAVNAEHRSEDQHKVILEIAAKALRNGFGDPERVLKVAEKVSRRAHLIKNVRAYATRALLRATKESPCKEEQLIDDHSVALTDNSQVERIEARILVRELLDALTPADREIFLRLMHGQTCSEIDASMNLKPRTAEIRSAVCKNALRRAVQKKLHP
jgi:DNA-directed RNA polymerase specialized sigma24 family protein